MSTSAPGTPHNHKSTPSTASTSTSTHDQHHHPTPFPDPALPPPLPPLHLAAQTNDLNTLTALLSPATATANATPSLSSPPSPSTSHSPAHLSRPSTSTSTSTTTVVTANDRDSQGITALHWAAINNHLLACKFLLEQGADVDARGGDLMATPLQWAARNGNLYIVHLLLKYGADPCLLDSQSFNTLHLSVHSSSAFLLAYILFTSQPIALDSTDLEGHTSLHWACYQGDAISVDLLLKAGADPRKPDQAGLTPLHWAAVKGNSGCIRRIVEAGGDLNAKEVGGKTPRDMAVELKSLPAFQRGLLEAGYDTEGRLETLPLSPAATKRAILVLPTATFFLVLNTVTVLPWWSGVLVGFGEFFAMHHVVSKVLLGIKGGQHSDRLTKSPYLCAIIVASIVWVGYVWLTRFAKGVEGYAVTNLLFAIGTLVCSYNFFRAITLDPGHVPFATNEAETKEMVDDLVEAGMLNGMNFCLTCLVRRPLRSKHSYVTKRCTARFDHYCPWVWNDIGVNNHRQFLLFVASLVFSIILFVRLAFGYFTLNSPPLSPDSACVLPSGICAAGTYDPFTFTVVLWSSLQLTWTIILLGAQLWQVCRQMTTLEVSNVGRYGFMGGKPGVSAAGQQGFIEKHSKGVTTGHGGGGGGGGEHVHGSGCDHGAGGRSGSGGGGGAGGPKPSPGMKAGWLLKILGIDRFTQGKAAEGLAKAGKVTNPFSVGVWGNCRDFWTRGRELGVDYTRLYEVPEGGFGRIVRERKRREKMDRAGGGNSGVGGGVALGRGSSGGVGGSGGSIGRGKGKAGYERVAMEDV